MASDEVALKDCYQELGVLLPFGGSVIICLVLAICLHHFKMKSKWPGRSKDANSSDHVVQINDQGNQPVDGIDIHKQDIEELQRECAILRTKLEETENAKRQAISRLSEQMSTNLRDGNPNIADLSDENRPANMKDKLSELYDNEYTEAVTHLETEYKVKLTEGDFLREVSAALLNILKVAFDVCTVTAKRQLFVMHQALVVPNVDLQTDTQTGSSIEHQAVTLPKEYLKKVKDIRKSFMPEISKLISETKSEFDAKYFEGSFANCLEAGPLKTYLNSCVQITWLMTIQDPPMYLNFHETDIDHLRAFTKSGPEIDYMVWPSVYIEEGGTSMAKGIAQFKEAVNDLIRF